MKNTQKGFVVPLLLGLIVVFLIGGGAYVYVQNKQGKQPTTQATSTGQTSSSFNKMSIRDVHKGDTFGDLTIKDVGYVVSPSNSGNEYISSAWVSFSGSIILSGKAYRSNFDTPNPICVTLDEKDADKIPQFKEGSSSTSTWFCFSNPPGELPATFRNLQTNPNEGIPVTIEINDYHQTVASEKDASNTASFVRIIQH